MDLARGIHGSSRQVSAPDDDGFCTVNPASHLCGLLVSRQSAIRAPFSPSTWHGIVTLASRVTSNLLGT